MKSSEKGGTIGDGRNKVTGSEAKESNGRSVAHIVLIVSEAFGDVVNHATDFSTHIVKFVHARGPVEGAVWWYIGHAVRSGVEEKGDNERLKNASQNREPFNGVWRDSSGGLENMGGAYINIEISSDSSGRPAIFKVLQSVINSLANGDFALIMIRSIKVVVLRKRSAKWKRRL